ncbi:hypothetical protein [uncultured Methanoregula sp.]|uniref:hypothetical protein n=1 Tax=uncultured Methanoregula sp. TaxID=1005933 RepID=UPI002AAAE473|nr:hypothetical protein [uncultured Methanoregula sp.]
MKPGKEFIKKPDSDMVNEPVKDDEGIDAFLILQIVGGIFVVIFIAWFILHVVMHLV